MSPKTAYEKICQKNRKKVLSDGRDVLELDRVWCHEITTPNAILDATSRGWDMVFDCNKVFTMIDHVNPAKDTASAKQGKLMRDWSNEHGIQFFDVGRNGVCHALIPEQGLILPGDVGIMGDSHTCTHGAFCSLSIGVGTTDLESGIITGLTTLGKQKIIRVNFTGILPADVFSKDLILGLIAHIGTDGATNSILEFGGSVIDQMNMEQRMTITNMSVEAGATTGMMMVDAKTIDYLWPIISESDISKSNALEILSVFNSDIDCEYDDVITIDVSCMRPVITTGYTPAEIVNVDEMSGTKIDQVYIGSCTNGRIEDLRIVAHVFGQVGGNVASNVRCIITPATQRVWQQANEEGILQLLAGAGCYISGPTCGACLGLSNGVLAPDEVCVSTTNRNFSGRMGKGGMVHLTNPAVAAYTALKGCIMSTEELVLDNRDDIFDLSIIAQKTVWKEKAKIKYIDYDALVKKTTTVDSIFSGRIFHFPKNDVDTDQIIPAKYLTEMDVAVFGEHCLEDANLNDSQKHLMEKASILVGGKNFGCGSSREHAVWAFRGAGINCIIASSFARIFETNMFNNGFLCVCIPQERISAMMKFVDEDSNVVVNVDDCIITIEGREDFSIDFSLTDYQRELIFAGGSVGVMIEMAAEIYK